MRAPLPPPRFTRKVTGEVLYSFRTCWGAMRSASVAEHVLTPPSVGTTLRSPGGEVPIYWGKDPLRRDHPPPEGASSAKGTNGRRSEPGRVLASGGTTTYPCPPPRVGGKKCPFPPACPDEVPFQEGTGGFPPPPLRGSEKFLWGEDIRESAPLGVPLVAKLPSRRRNTPPPEKGGSSPRLCPCQRPRRGARERGTACTLLSACSGYLVLAPAT